MYNRLASDEGMVGTNTGYKCQCDLPRLHGASFKLGMWFDSCQISYRIPLDPLLIDDWSVETLREKKQQIMWCYLL